MTQEKPLKGLADDIAAHLGTNAKAAKRHLEKHKVPTFKIGRYVCCYASTLKKCEEGTYWHSNDPSTALLPAIK